jgi:hypothetical protein
MSAQWGDLKLELMVPYSKRFAADDVSRLDATHIAPHLEGTKLLHNAYSAMFGPVKVGLSMI